MSATSAETRFVILAAVGDPQQLQVLLAVTAPLARQREGHGIPIFVGRSTERPKWLAVPSELSDVVSEPQFAAASDVAEKILSHARRLKPDLLLLHWRGEPSRGRYLLGRTLDPVIQFAPCDVAIVRVPGRTDGFAERIASLKHVLVPSGGGPNAAVALGIALDLGSDVQVTAVRVASKGAGPTAISAQWAILRDLLAAWPDEDRLEPHVALASGVLEGILQEVDDECDVVLIGATRESLVDRLIFGNLPQQLATSLPVPSIIVRRHDPVALGVSESATQGGSGPTAPPGND